jgi:hypothetical protein
MERGKAAFESAEGGGGDDGDEDSTGWTLSVLLQLLWGGVMC